ncbi:Aste57867_19430 [Aphanomyces stellatus]|uniref:Aste57867_19430 protein n=1 Tax=Aphanomyces stellatus TaxID=120398 RepID=A0A485LD60_9STRA|nr:hypothetical protein As57867_019366 [Aphanomyces stellatus]VFT96144.1 Aste57867_19430 [Aphanomyces stellatus]
MVVVHASSPLAARTPDEVASSTRTVSLEELHPHVTADTRALVHIHKALGTTTRHGSVFFQNVTPSDPGSGSRRGRASVIHLQRQLTVTAIDTYPRLHLRTRVALAIFHTGISPLDDPFAVANLPLDVQRRFRVKLLGGLGLQLACVSLVVALLSFASVFGQALGWWLGALNPFVALGLAAASLLLLTCLQHQFPLNDMALLVFTAAQAVLCVSIDLHTASHVMVTASFYATGAIVAVAMLSTRVVSDASGQRQQLVPPFRAAAMAYVVTTIPLLVVHGCHGAAVLTTLELVALLAASVVGMVWVAYETMCLTKRLSPDEYAHGSTLFYTDALLFGVAVVPAIVGNTITSSTRCGIGCWLQRRMRRSASYVRHAPTASKNRLQDDDVVTTQHIPSRFSPSATAFEPRR